MAKFRIGITAIGYNCREHLDKVFASWQKIKDGELSDLIESVRISFAHGIFVETAKLGFPIASVDGTIEFINRCKTIDNRIVFEKPQEEFDMWTSNLPYLCQEDSNLLWMINADEVWEIDEIRKALEFVQNSEFTDSFKVNFKNYCIDYRTYVSDFIVPRIWHMRVHGGIRRFYKDELVEYNNGKKWQETAYRTIPGIFPKHYSWVGSKEYLKRKLAFQAVRYKTCSYRWNEQTDSLELNDDYYRQFNIPKPTLNFE